MKKNFIFRTGAILFMLLVTTICFYGQAADPPLGDVNGSGFIDIIDALMTAQYTVGLNPARFIEKAADVNCDKSVNIIDALIIAQYYVGLIRQFPCNNTTNPPTAVPTPPPFSGFAILRLAPRLAPVPDDYVTLYDAAKYLKLAPLMQLIDVYKMEKTGRLIRSLKIEEILKLEKNALQSELRPLHSLTSYWRIDLRDLEEKIDEIILQLNRLEEVELAYKEHSVTEPVVNAANDPYNSGQDYLDPAPVGIDARWAWTQPDCEGAGIGFVDLEQGWFLNHEDFVTKAPAIIYGDNRDGEAYAYSADGIYHGNHGTAVLGQVIADDNTIGVVGIAPSVSSVRMTSHYDNTTDTALHVADAIAAAIPVMNTGDVLLLEIQRGGRPTEIDAGDFDAIRLAVASGIIVVEAAGNGNHNLDIYTNTAGDTFLNRLSPDFLDSGAIMVGAAQSAPTHNRASFSSYGTRIDCYGWGENIVTCGYGDLDAGTGDNSTYTDTFGGTSGASPIIAGAALILQGRYAADTGSRISPMQMRTILSDPATGTAQGGAVAGHIGVMPDLRAILEDVYETIPDVFLRDNLGDLGAVPTTGGISASPDIITRPVAETDPQAAFGTGSGTENSNTLGAAVTPGQNNYIYVRMRNRGNSDLLGVTATVYYCEPSTLVTPDMWHWVGTTTPLDVPADGNLWVADPIVWSSGSLPPEGHYCYVGILDHPADPAPPLPGPTDWNGFLNLIRDNNNITWRNFDVIDPDASDPALLPFHIVGAPDRELPFDLEILRKLSERVRVWLEVDMRLADQILKQAKFEYIVDEKNGTVRFLMPAASPVSLRDILLEKGARHKSRFIVEGSRDFVESGDWLAIRQLFKGQEAGRITWQFEPKENK